jgi:hypothetical protein
VWTHRQPFNGISLVLVIFTAFFFLDHGIISLEIKCGLCAPMRLGCILSSLRPRCSLSFGHEVLPILATAIAVLLIASFSISELSTRHKNISATEMVVTCGLQNLNDRFGIFLQPDAVFLATKCRSKLGASTILNLAQTNQIIH